MSDIRLIGPPGFSMEPYRANLHHPYMRDPELVNDSRAIAWRRRLCTTSPVLFALYYLSHHLLLPDPDTDGALVCSLSEFHVELAMAAKRWMRRDIRAKEVRDAWVAPRGAGKTSWQFLILTLWAMAYGHRKFIVVYSDVERMAIMHLKDTFKSELHRNTRLRRDFPELCTPLRHGGRAVMNDATGFWAANESAIMVRGMNSATLGIKLRNRRPDAMIMDDIEPQEGRYSPEMKATRLNNLINAILPCGQDAVVQFVGTTVMHGSIMHDMITGAKWVGAQNIAVHHYKALAEDPVTGVERSLWPSRWSVAYLRGEREGNPRGYALNFDNVPRAEDGTFWTEEHITYKDLSDEVVERVLVIDPAVKSKKTSDETSIGMFGFARARGQVSVERVIGVRCNPAQLREQVHSIVRNNSIKLVIVDVTNGGDYVTHALVPMPAGTRVGSVNIRDGKNSGRKVSISPMDRFAKLHDRYLRRPTQVVHARAHPSLEQQMLAYPKVMHDDQIDVVALGVAYFFGELNVELVT
jgi:phage terminase large subunit-like protein